MAQIENEKANSVSLLSKIADLEEKCKASKTRVQNL